MIVNYALQQSLIGRKIDVEELLAGTTHTCRFERMARSRRRRFVF
jgi:hypothetical protein